MTTSQPVAFVNGCFWSFGGRRWAPEVRDIRIGDAWIGRNNTYKAAADMGVPRSLLFSLCSGQTWFAGMEGMDETKVAFYDIETEDTSEGEARFQFGYVKSLNGRAIRYDNPVKMSEALRRYNVVIGFNSYRFDNEILAKTSPEHFETVDLPQFKLAAVRDVLNLDALMFYALWEPFERSHKLQLLGLRLGIDIPGLDDKEKRCEAELQVLSQFWPHMAKLYDWFVTAYRIDPLTLFTLPVRNLAKLRRWCLQAYLTQLGIYTRPFRCGATAKAEYLKIAKPGYYKRVHIYDVKSAYPTTAANLELTLYEKGDFSAYMRMLIAQRDDSQNEGIRQTIKWLANASIGDMGNPEAEICNQAVMAEIWNTFKVYMEGLVKKVGKKNVIYAMTDSIYTQGFQPLSCMHDGYTVVEKSLLEHFVVYNQTRTLSLDAEGKVKRTQFQRAYPALGFWRLVDAEVDQKLREDFEGFCNNPKIDINMRMVDSKELRSAVRKNDSICERDEYWDIWPKLKMGFNDLYLGKKGWVFSQGKLDFKRYESLVKKHLELYRLPKKGNKILKSINSRRTA